MIILASILSGLSILMCILMLVRMQMPNGFYGLPLKMLTVALSPLWFLFGFAGAILGWFYQAYWVIPFGAVSAGVMFAYIWRVSRSHNGFEKAFGPDWEDKIPPARTKHMIQRRWNAFVSMKTTPETTWERDIAFWTINDTNRQLLCDMWYPAKGDVSGLAFIFLHGGAWYMMDKDMLTRPFFRHLVAQGHTVMDVAYRLCPEVDIFGMIGDVKRAIAWMKSNASRYRVNPDKIVLGGGSAGGHLALLAGYTHAHPGLTPAELNDTDLSVSGVISYYGPTDMLAEYEHTNQKQMLDQELPAVTIGPDATLTVTPATWRMDVLLGGWPQEALASYQLASPSNHVDPNCPPTLLIQGDRDFITPVGATRELYSSLEASRVPAINVVFPWTDHAFDMMLPQINPAAQSALYDVDRFLAFLSSEG